MKGDFTRDTFDASNRFTRVLMQQGRVQLDADWNEQAEIVLYYLRALSADLIGQHGGPTDNLGFGVSVAGSNPPPGDFLISKGVYYVDGIRCENEKQISYANQKDYPLTPADELEEGPTPNLVFLDVWERQITQNEYENLREVALGGPDTTTRTQLVTQVKRIVLDAKAEDPTNVEWIINHQPAFSADEKRALIEMGLPLLRAAAKVEKDPARLKAIEDNIKKLEAILAALNGALLRARAFVAQPSTDPCTISPEARYRGMENQLYRVEIHRSGSVWDGKPATAGDAATFKFSRENGSVAFRIRELEGKVATLEHLGRDERFGLREGDCVEVVDDDYVLHNRAQALLFVEAIDRDRLQVTFDRAPDGPVGQNPNRNPLLRRWDHNGRRLKLDAGAVLLLEGQGNDENWLTLEDGVQIQFQKPAAGTDPTQYRTGDYWLIPARTATGDVEWPGPTDDPKPLPPRGIKHHFAPLHRITIGAGGVVTAKPADTLRRHFDAQAIFKP